MEKGRKEQKKPPKRNAKDTVFTSLFRDKRYLLRLYQALHPVDVGAKAEDLKIITLENIMAGGIFNDLGFMLKEKGRPDRKQYRSPKNFSLVRNVVWM